DIFLNAALIKELFPTVTTAIVSVLCFLCPIVLHYYPNVNVPINLTSLTTATNEKDERNSTGLVPQ
ncbi:hypothetical protein K0M31_005376, partial [Melipona bicolor]